MPVKIIPKFKVSDIKKSLMQHKQIIVDAMVRRLQFIGEKFILNGREKGTYQDRTGNLRSSIAYVILFDGKQLSKNFEGATKEGVRFAKKAIADISAKYPQGFAFIGVAGMEYAAAVESRGYDVITSSATIAATSLKNSMKQLQKSLNRL